MAGGIGVDGVAPAGLTCPGGGGSRRSCCCPGACCRCCRGGAGALRRSYARARNMARWRSCGIYSSMSMRMASGKPPVNRCAH
jgi:hypothetical protein